MYPHGERCKYQGGKRCCMVIDNVILRSISGSVRVKACPRRQCESSFFTGELMRSPAGSSPCSAFNVASP